MVCSMQHRHQAETSYIRSLIQSGVRGLIFFGGAMENERQIINAAKRVPVVLGDRRMPNESIDCVGTDNVDIMRRLIGRLAVPEHPELAEKTVIMNYVSEDVPLAPVLMMHGNKDRLVPFEQSIELYECLNKNNKDVTFYKLTEADHGGVYFWHETTLKIVDNFIKDRLQ